MLPGGEGGTWAGGGGGTLVVTLCFPVCLVMNLYSLHIMYIDLYRSKMSLLNT